MSIKSGTGKLNLQIYSNDIKRIKFIFIFIFIFVSYLYHIQFIFHIYAYTYAYTYTYTYTYAYAYTYTYSYTYAYTYAYYTNRPVFRCMRLTILIPSSFHFQNIFNQSQMINIYHLMICLYVVICTYC